LGVQVPLGLPLKRKEMIQFFKDVWFEMTQKVTWPTARRLVTATTIIIVFVLIWAVIIFAFDSVFISAQKFVISDYYDTVALKHASDGKITIDQVKRFATAADRDKYMTDEETKGTPGYGKNPDTTDTTNQNGQGGTTIPVSPGGNSTTIPLPVGGSDKTTTPGTTNPKTPIP
jgi:preprotein translocase SecE subunit